MGFTHNLPRINHVQPVIKTRAKTYALTTCPHYHSSISIYTDSQNVIDNFYKITNKLLSIRRLLKINNHNAWRLIDIIIELKSLKVSLKLAQTTHTTTLYPVQPANSTLTLTPTNIFAFASILDHLLIKYYRHTKLF